MTAHDHEVDGDHEDMVSSVRQRAGEPVGVPPSELRAVRRRRALIVGASRGPGRWLAESLTASHSHVTLVSRSRHHDWISELPVQSASLISADLSLPESVGIVVTAVGTEPLDLLVYSAAQWEPDSSISATTEREMADLVNVSLTSFISIVQHLAKPLSAASRAVVVVLGSTAGLSNQAAGRPGYAAAKAGLRSACVALNQQFAGTSVTVTCLSLGAIGPTDRAPDASARISYTSIGATIDYLADLPPTATVTEIVMPGRDFDTCPGTDG